MGSPLKANSVTFRRSILLPSSSMLFCETATRSLSEVLEMSAQAHSSVAGIYIIQKGISSLLKAKAPGRELMREMMDHGSSYEKGLDIIGL